MVKKNLASQHLCNLEPFFTTSAPNLSLVEITSFKYTFIEKKLCVLATLRDEIRLAFLLNELI